MVTIGAEAVLLILPRANSRAEELGKARSSMQDYMTKMWCSERIYQGAFRYRNGTLAWRGVQNWLAAG